MLEREIGGLSDLMLLLKSIFTYVLILIYKMHSVLRGHEWGETKWTEGLTSGSKVDGVQVHFFCNELIWKRWWSVVQCDRCWSISSSTAELVSPKKRPEWSCPLSLTTVQRELEIKPGLMIRLRSFNSSSDVKKTRLDLHHPAPNIKGSVCLQICSSLSCTQSLSCDEHQVMNILMAWWYWGWFWFWSLSSSCPPPMLLERDGSSYIAPRSCCAGSCAQISVCPIPTTASSEGGRDLTCTVHQYMKLAWSMMWSLRCNGFRNMRKRREVHPECPLQTCSWSVSEKSWAWREIWMFIWGGSRLTVSSGSECCAGFFLLLSGTDGNDIWVSRGARSSLITTERRIKMDKEPIKTLNIKFKVPPFKN